MSDKDHIIVDKAGDHWISVKDASDLLGCSERHVWRLALQHGWETKKEKSEKKRKTYVLRSAVVLFYEKERARHPLSPLSNSDNPDMSDKKSLSDMPDIARSDLRPLSDAPLSDLILAPEMRKSLPALLEDYAKTKSREAVLIKRVALWQSSTFWLGVLAVAICGFLSYILSDFGKRLSVKETLLSEKEEALVASNTALVSLNATASSLSDKVLLMSDKVDLLNTQLRNSRSWINKVESLVPAKELDKLKGDSVSENGQKQQGEF